MNTSPCHNRRRESSKFEWALFDALDCDQEYYEEIMNKSIAQDSFFEKKLSQNEIFADNSSLEDEELTTGMGGNPDVETSESYEMIDDESVHWITYCGAKSEDSFEDIATTATGSNINLELDQKFGTLDDDAWHEDPTFRIQSWDMAWDMSSIESEITTNSNLYPHLPFNKSKVTATGGNPSMEEPVNLPKFPSENVLNDDPEKFISAQMMKKWSKQDDDEEEDGFHSPEQAILGNQDSKENSSETGDLQKFQDDIEPIELIPKVLLNSYKCNSEHETFASLRVSAIPSLSLIQNRKPVDLVVVMDKSGSMKGLQLEMCKRTVEYLFTQLQDTDKFSLFTFDRFINSEPLEKMTDQRKDRLTRYLQILEAEEAPLNSNLGAALFSAIEEVMRVCKCGIANEKQSIVLLTDGIPTAGIKLAGQLIKAFKSVYNDLTSLSVFTFGYGTSQNSELLEQISAEGNGMYHKIENETHLLNACKNCLGCLLPIIARNLTVEFKAVNRTIIKRTCIPSSDVKKGHVVRNRKHSIDIGDLVAGQHVDILVKIKLPFVAEDPIELCPAVRCSLKYDDIFFSGVSKLMETNIVVHRTAIDSIPSYNLDIIIACNRIVAAKAIDEAKSQVKSGGGKKLVAARHCLRNAIAGIKASYCILDHSAVHMTNSRDLVSDLEKYLKGLVFREKHGAFKVKNTNQVGQPVWR